MASDDIRITASSALMAIAGSGQDHGQKPPEREDERPPASKIHPSEEEIEEAVQFEHARDGVTLDVSV